MMSEININDHNDHNDHNEKSNKSNKSNNNKKNLLVVVNPNSGFGYSLGYYYIYKQNLKHIYNITLFISRYPNHIDKYFTNNNNIIKTMDVILSMGGDGISRVWHPGIHENKNQGWAGAPDIIAEYKGQLILGDLKTSNGPYYSRWPGSETPKGEYGKRRAGFVKYTKCQLQLAAYSLAIEHTIDLVPEIFMTFVATRESVQVFAIQSSTIAKYKQKWLDTVDKYYNEILPKQQETKIEMEGIDGDTKEHQ